jgi:hydroxymethylbilane synthase
VPGDTISKANRQTIVVGTRGSELALTQTKWVIDQLVRHRPDLEVQLETVRTEGDILRSASLAQIGGTGVFVKEIEAALLAGEIDLAVHSLKDLPVQQPAGLAIGAVCPREDPRDVLISTRAGGLDGLPQGAAVGTGSLRRRAQLLLHRPDLEILDIRGNVGTRLRKLRDEDLDAIVLAAAGLRRLGHTVREDQYLPLDVMLPAVGQGALAVEVRDGDPVTMPLVAAVNDPMTRAAVLAEMAFLAAFGGGCAVPIGAYAEVIGDTVRLKGIVVSLDGARHLEDEQTGPLHDPDAVGQSLARALLDRGAGDIINGVIHES